MNRLSSFSSVRAYLLPKSKPQFPSRYTLPLQGFASSKNTSPFVTTQQNRKMASKISTDDIFAVFKQRHSVYGVKNTSKVPDARLEQIVKDTLENYPNSFNYQQARIALVLGQKNHQLWEAIINAAQGPLTQGMGEAGWKGFEPRLRGFQAAYGSVVFFDDEDTIKQQQSDHPHIGSLFQQWADHANGMAEYMIWVAFENEGVGASLQHLNMLPGVPEAIAKELGTSATWTPKAQLVFGDPSGEWPGQKEKLPFDKTLKVIK